MRILAIIIIALLIGVAVYYALNPPKPKVVVVGPPATTTTTTAPQPTTAAGPPSVAAMCQTTYVSVNNTSVCGVVSVSPYANGLLIEAKAPGWITGKFSISNIYATCQFSVVDGRLYFSGPSCVIDFIIST